MKGEGRSRVEGEGGEEAGWGASGRDLLHQLAEEASHGGVIHLSGGDDLDQILSRLHRLQRGVDALKTAASSPYLLSSRSPDMPATPAPPSLHLTHRLHFSQRKPQFLSTQHLKASHTSHHSPPTPPTNPPVLKTKRHHHLLDLPPSSHCPLDTQSITLCAAVPGAHSDRRCERLLTAISIAMIRLTADTVA